MGCNCNDKTYSISMGCCEPVLAPIQNYYTKYQIDKMIEEIESGITSGCCITPEEVDEKIASAKTEIENEIPSLSGYATEQWVLDKHYISGVDLSDYALKSEIPTVPTSNTAFTNDAGYLTEHQSLSGYVTDAEMSAFTYDKATIDEKVAQGGTFDPTQYYNTAQTINLVESAVTRVEGEIPSLSGYATEQWVLDKHYISGVDLSDYALKSEIPTVPTSNTAFTNDAGYLTEHQQLKTINNQTITGTGNITIECECSGVTSGEVQTMIDQSVSGKVDTTTYNTYTASTQTTINSKADSSTLNNYLLKNKIWCGTESEYNSITTKDSETLYLIHE